MKTILIPGEQFRIHFVPTSGTSVYTATMVDYERGDFELGAFTYRMDFEEWEILPVRPLYA